MEKVNIEGIRLSTILENNRLLAEFMGWEVHPSYPNKMQKKGIQQGHRTLSDFVFIENLDFDKSWDCLMPVYNKLSLELDVAWEITSKGVVIHNHNNGFGGRWAVNCPYNVMIDAYRAVVEFVKWYNENGK